MLKLLLVYLSQAQWARNIVQRWGFAKKTAARFVAGETLDEAVVVVRKLGQKGICATLDHLGENVTSQENARQAADEIIHIINRLSTDSLCSGISIKLSQIGLVVDPVLCEENLRRIMAKARQEEIFVRIDMEDSELTQRTLDLFRKVRDEEFAAQIGIVIQASLHRSEQDVKDLLAKDSKIRICKGAYKEPRHIAFHRKADVDENFDRISRLLLDRSLETGSKISEGGGTPPLAAIATHDPLRIENACKYAERIGLKKTGLEFQMLHGIREDLQATLVKSGYPVRVYVPYGQEWYPYFVRRLAERPANLWFFLSNLVRR
ncbi:MAG TPA: proline dehydrogenase [Chloroflexi bacterium]|nr:proline dehydrogenase [Chloroflexota bacterium]